MLMTKIRGFAIGCAPTFVMHSAGKTGPAVLPLTQLEVLHVVVWEWAGTRAIRKGVAAMRARIHCLEAMATSSEMRE